MLNADSSRFRGLVMAFTIDDNGNITCVQGDSGSLSVSGIPTDRNYTIFFAMQDENRNPIGTELSIETNKMATVMFFITGALTDLLKVKKGEETATYYYGIKLCNTEDNTEDTLLLGNGSIGSRTAITVYPKKVEGIE